MNDGALRLTAAAFGGAAMLLAATASAGQPVPGVPRADSDLEWRIAQSGWVRVGTLEEPVLALYLLAPTDEILAGTYFEGLLISRDRGATWQRSLEASVGCVAAAGPEPAPWYVGAWEDGALRSNDGGESWIRASTGLAANDVTALVVDPADDTIYAGTEFGVFRSLDGADTWEAASNGFGGRNVYALEFAGAAVLAGTDRGVFRSEDGADVWVAANRGLRANEVYALASGHGVTYAGTDRGVFRSLDDGASWQAASTGLPRVPIVALSADPDQPGVVFAAGARGVFASANSGQLWIDIGDGLTGDSRVVYALALDTRPQPMQLYAGSGSGVWRRPVVPAQTVRNLLPVALKGHVYPTLGPPPATPTLRQPSATATASPTPRVATTVPATRQPSATAMPSASPTHTSEATETPRPSFVDDFSDPTSGWPRDATDQWSERRYENGAYLIHPKVGGVMIASRPGTVDDFAVEVDMRRDDELDGGIYGLALRHKPTTDYLALDWYYAVWLNPTDGTFTVSRWQNGWTFLTADTPSPHIHGRGITNRLRVEMVGEHIAVHVNGHLLTEVEDERLTSGWIGLLASGEGMRALFDDFRLWNLR